MKSYLNKNEKTEALTFATFIAYAEERADEWQKHGRSKDGVKYLRMAKSFMGKALDTMFEGLDMTERVKVIPEIKKMEVVVKYKDEAIREYDRILALDSVTPIKTNDFYEICGQAVEVCQSCQDNQPDKCQLRALFIRYDVPVFNESPEPGECPYKIMKGEVAK